MNNIDLYNAATRLLNDNHLKYEVSSFDSGAFIIDFYIKEHAFCIQLYNSLIGISDITAPDFLQYPILALKT